MPMNEKQKEMLDKLLKRIDLVTLGVLIALLAAVVYLYLQEKGNVIEVPEKPAPPAWSETIESSDSFKKVQESFFVTQTDISQDELARRAIQNNMFDRKSVEEQAKIAKELNDQYNRAEDQFKSGNIPAAQRILDEILARDANHGPANELKRRIDRELNPETPAPTPEAAAP